MRPILVIALNTFRENLRDKVLYNLLFFCILLIAASVLLAHLTIAEQNKIMTDMGLAVINLVGVLLGVFVGIGLVSKELDRRTIHTIMARPLSRSQFILGKYGGLTLTLLINLSIMLAGFLAALWLNSVPIHAALLQAIALIFVEVLLVTAVALMFSTFSSSTLSATMTLGLYVIGHLTADLKGIAEKTSSGGVKAVMTGLYYLCPNLEMLNIKGQAAMGVAVAPSYLATAVGYGLCYAALAMAAACLMFQRRDF